MLFKLAPLCLSWGISVIPAVGSEAADPGERWIKRTHEQKKLQPFQIEAYKQLSCLCKCQFQQFDHRGNIMVVSFSKDTEQPTDMLYNMGLKVLPILAEALTDETPSKTITSNRGRTKHVWKVNEFVARLICIIADRSFFLGTPEKIGLPLYSIREHPESQAEFQKLVLEWYEQNKNRTPEERKIADFSSNFLNRLNAMRWLGEHQSTKAAPILEARIDKILRNYTGISSDQSEIAEASLALGLIRLPSTYPAVQKACKFMSDRIYNSYRPLEQGRSGGCSMLIYNLFKAYQGMALLGYKEQALAELQRLWNEYGKEMDACNQKEYSDNLKAARLWCAGSAGATTKTSAHK